MTDNKKHEALIFVKPFPGKTQKVVELIARGKTPESRDDDYKEEAIRKVYLAPGEYDIIVHASHERAEEIFFLASRIRAITASTEGAVSETKTIPLWPKGANDP
jgi:hypothetical protein